MKSPAFTPPSTERSSHWWFQGMRTVLFAIIDPLATLRRRALVLEIVSTTIGLSRSFRRRYTWQMIVANTGGEGVAALPPSDRPPNADVSLTACPFREGVFDGLVCLDVLNHVDHGDELGVLIEFARLVRPGGFLILRVAASEAFADLQSSEPLRQRFSSEHLTNSVGMAGFRIVRSSYANVLLLPLGLLKARLWDPWFHPRRKPGWPRLPDWINRLLEIPFRLEAKLLEHGRNFIIGQSIVVTAVRQPVSLEGSPRLPDHAGKVTTARELHWR